METPSENLDSAGAAPERLVKALWPCSVPYLAWPLRSEFIVDFSAEPARAFGAETIVVRDGMIPLLWFFHLHPSPAPFRFRLLVHESLVDFVPGAWRENTGSYFVESRLEKTQGEGEEERPPEELLIGGLTLRVHCSLKALQQKLTGLRAQFPLELWPRLKKSVYASVRTDYSGDGFSSFETAFLLELGRSLPGPIDALDWGALEMRESFAKTFFADLNEGLLCADNYIAHMVLSRGGRVWGEPPPVPEGAKRVELSPYHGLVTGENLGEAPSWLGRWQSERAPEYEHYFRHIDSMVVKSETTRPLFPWPAWFEASCLALFTETRRHDV